MCRVLVPTTYKLGAVKLLKSVKLVADKLVIVAVLALNVLKPACPDTVKEFKSVLPNTVRFVTVVSPPVKFPTVVRPLILIVLNVLEPET